MGGGGLNDSADGISLEGLFSVDDKNVSLK